MDKLNIFISSTYYDFYSLRDSLKKEILGIGHNALLHENGGIFYNPNEHTHVSCIEAVEKNCDILILVIGSRFGGVGVSEVFNHLNLQDLKDKSNFKQFFIEGNKYSITQCEYLKAVEKNIPVITFTEKRVLDAKHMYDKVEKGGVVDPKDVPYFDSTKENSNAKNIFEFIKYITHRTENNQIIPFDGVDDISAYLKNYLSQYFKRLLHTTDTSTDEEIEYIPKRFPAEKIIDYFFDDSNRKKSIQTVETQIDFDDKGHCKYEAKIKVRPIDHLTHYHYQVYSDKVGIMKVNDFRIIGTPSEATYFGIKKGTHMRLTLFFKEPKIDDFTINIKLKIENYLSDLVDTKKGTLHRSVTNGLKEVTKIEEVLSFPNTPLFQNLKIKIIKHPEASQVGKYIKHSVVDNKKIFRLKFSKKDKTNFKRDTQVEFFL